jgi:hypothetical protein
VTGDFCSDKLPEKFAMDSLDNAFRVVFLVGAIGALCGAVWLGSYGQTGAVVTVATIAVAFSAFAFLTKFKRFKALGLFEGELWEHEMEQAAELRRQLTELAEQLGESVVWQMTPRRPLQGGRPFQEKFAIVERTAKILMGIGVSTQKIEEIKRPWHKFIMWEPVRPIV